MNHITDILRSNQASFHRVIPFDGGTGNLILLDFTRNNKELSDEIVSDTTRFTNYINQKLTSSHSQFGIGGYGEYRELYSRSKVFDEPHGEEPRRLHLGTDI